MPPFREILCSETKTHPSIFNALENIQIYTFSTDQDFQELMDKIRNEEVNKINFTKFTDTMIVVDKAVILCHSFVLFSQESKLVDMIMNFFDEDKGFTIIDFSNKMYSKNAIVLMLLYYYTGKINSHDQVDIKELKEFNKLLQCKDLKKLLRQLKDEGSETDSENEDNETEEQTDSE